jgi:hypothetical protein
LGADLAGVAGAVGGCRKAAVQTEIEAIAAHLPCFDTDDLLYDRMLEIGSYDIQQADEAPYRRYIGEVIALQAGERELLPLLN